MQSFKLKKINQNHKNILYKWHNLKSVLKNSLKGKKFTMEEHTKWFSKQLHSKNIIRIIYIRNKPIGIIRLEKKTSDYLISYMIAPKYRGRGIAYTAIKKLLSNVRKKGVNKIIGLVNKNNTHSLKIFSKLRFKQKIIRKSKRYLKFEYEF